MPTYLIGPHSLVASLPEHIRRRAECIAAEELYDARWAEVEGALAGGASLIAIGTEALPRLRVLWIDSYECEASPPSLKLRRTSGLQAPDADLLPMPQVPWRAVPCRGLFVRPEQFKVYFGHDEMPRMDLVPLLEAVDGDGHACAYPAAWFRHFASSLVGGRFAGSNWCLFALEEPLQALDASGWAEVIEALCDHAEAALSIADVTAHYACYRGGETVLVSARLANRSPAIAAARLELTAETPDGRTWTSRWIRRCLNGNEEITVPWELPCARQRAPGDAPGLWRVRLELYHEDRFVYGARRAAEACLIERAECGFVVVPQDLSDLPRPQIEGRSLRIGDRDGFLAGTHYYPSSSWFDWAWRDFRPEKAARDLAEMERLGYSFARVWVDPELDEQALRGLEAWLYLSGMRGIVSIICVFSQWPRHLSYPDERGMTTFEFMGPADYNVYAVQLINIEHQQRYLATLGRRWAHLPNIIWNLANETQIVDPDPEQVDPRWFGDVEPRTGPYAGAAYFNRWADLMTEALREAGARQPVLRGYGFIMAGDCYLQNRSGDLLTWHHYAPGEVQGPCLALAHPGLIDKPLLQEEFGIPSFDEGERLERYEGVACWSVVMGAAGACSYEWGVSWLARELSYVATPLKDSCLFPEPDPRWARGQLQYSGSWPTGSVGICPWAASFCFGSNYGCTPFTTSAAQALGEVARFCADIGPPAGTEPVVLLVPSEWADFVPHEGYMRQLDPTYQTVQALAAAHVPFTVIQEDQLPDLEEPPVAIVFPATQQIRAETQNRLDALATRGVAIHVGEAEGYVADLAQYAIQVGSDEPVWCLRRGTRAGHLYFLYAERGPTEVTLATDQAQVTLKVSRYALVEVTGDGSVRTLVGRGGERRAE